MADALLKAFADADGRAVVEWLRGMPEPERRTHAERLIALKHESAGRVIRYGRFRGLRIEDEQRDDASGLAWHQELCAQTGAGPRHSRAHLATLNQKAAKALLGRAGEPDESALFLAARVRRAQRWIG